MNHRYFFFCISKQWNCICFLSAISAIIIIQLKVLYLYTVWYTYLSFSHCSLGYYQFIIISLYAFVYNKVKHNWKKLRDNILAASTIPTIIQAHRWYTNTSVYTYVWKVHKKKTRLTGVMVWKETQNSHAFSNILRSFSSFSIPKQHWMVGHYFTDNAESHTILYTYIYFWYSFIWAFYFYGLHLYKQHLKTLGLLYTFVDSMYRKMYVYARVCVCRYSLFSLVCNTTHTLPGK